MFPRGNVGREKEQYIYGAPEDFDCHCQLNFWLESAIYCQFLFHNSS